ncbi:DUF6624 domain-containing protein [Streptomyces sp. NRRL F-5193]|uniref:DUF6624 domain-containing protein n=1 Tax=Streptomyces sp. NRRL F-5193 TaxID=1463860 RepID=UPI0006919599|nr:DUF6624 domain-containing protein [Streptomyces sp. NRRL F-5193]
MSADRLPQTRSVMSTAPMHPHLARELIARAERADEHWARLARMQPADQQIGAARHIDHGNTAVLARAVADYGWPGVPLVGEEGARAAWRLALRADTRADVQRLASRLMYEAVGRGTASLRQWAHLCDRCLVNAYLSQLYGTQYRLGPDGPELQRVSDPAGDLDARRAAVGLPTAGLALGRLRDRLAADPRFGAAAPAVLMGAA